MAKSKQPRGRPKGSRNEATIIKELVKRRIKVNSADGTAQPVTLGEALMQRFTHQALGGDVDAVKRLAAVNGRLDPDTEAVESSGVLLVPSPQSEAEWVREEDLRNKFKEAPEMPAPEPESAGSSNHPVSQSSKQSLSSELGSRPKLRNKLIR